MRLLTYCLLFVSLCICNSCQEGLSDCFKRTGVKTVREYSVPPFRTLYVNDGLQVTIVQKAPHQVTLVAGTHLISSIRVEVQDNVLMLSDDIGCDWARKYETKEVIVQSPDLRAIYQNGYGDITSLQTLTYDTLSIQPRYGQGNVHLDVQAKYVEVISHRNGTVTLTGQTDYLNVKFLDNNAIFNGKELEALNVDMAHHCNNSFHLHPVFSLRGRIAKKGDVYLYHWPEHQDVEITGKGRLIDVSAEGS